MSHKHHHRSVRPTVSDPREQALERVVDLGLAGVVFVLPFCMGGRQALGQFLLVALATLVGVAWTARQTIAREGRWRGTAAQWLLLAGVLLVFVQLVPLSESWLARLSPEIPRLLPLWMSSAGEAQIGPWNQLSLTPEATRDGLVQWLAYSTLFLVIVQRITSIAHVERLLRWIAWSTAAMACFGLLQYLASNGKFFWIYQHPIISTADCVRGAFTNRNHFAHFLALGLGPLLWWVQSNWKNSSAANPLRGGLAALLLGLVLFAALMSFSRGGAVALLSAAAAYLVVAWRASLLSRRFVLAIGGLSLLVVAMLLVHGYRSVAGRLDDLASGSLEQLDPSQGRRKVWTAVSSVITDFPLLGSGIGSHREIYHRYFAEPSLTEYTHAESGYLQVAEESGLVGVALLAAGVVVCGCWCFGAWRSGQSRPIAACMAAIVASLFASVVHSAYDFVWYVPSCAALVALLAGCAFHLRRLSGVEAVAASQPLPRWGWATACGILLLAGTAAAAGRWGAILAEPHGDRYRIASRNVSDPQAAADLMLEHFSAMVAHDSGDARSQLALAEACLRQFDLAQKRSENPMSLTAIRDAAAAGGFPGRAELAAWLDRALGARRTWLDKALWHTRQSLALCPLQGQGYLYLAELAFLEQADGRRTSALIDQALAVRPHDGGVLFKAGEEAALAGDAEAAVAYWKRAFHSNPVIQAQLIEYLASRNFPLAFFLEQLDPDHAAMQILHRRYRGAAPAEEYRSFLERFAQSAAQAAADHRGTPAANLWLEAHRSAVELQDHVQAWQHAQAALTADPSNFYVRLAVAQYLLAQQRPAEAEQHFKWCLDRRPADEQLRAALETATKGRIDAQTQASAGGPQRQ